MTLKNSIHSCRSCPTQDHLPCDAGDLCDSVVCKMLFTLHLKRSEMLMLLLLIMSYKCSTPACMKISLCCGDVVPSVWKWLPCCSSVGVFWGTLLFWLSLPARRKSPVSLHKGSHWPLPPLAGRPLAPLRAEWISLTPFPAVLLNLTSGTPVISTAPPSGAGPTIPVACGGAPVAPRQGGSAALLQSAPSYRWNTWQGAGTPCEPPANQTGWREGSVENYQ